MNKIITIAAILSLAIVASMVLTPTALALPGIKRPMDIYVATIQGGSPQTVDYSWAYDTASGEIIFNTMDTLIMFNAEHTDTYLPDLAASWSLVNLGPGGIDTGLSVAGLNFENPTNQTGTAKYYYRYVFGLNTTAPIFFQTFPNGTQGYQLTAQDVVYSFQRTLVQDRVSGPSWMLYEPLLDNPIGGDNTGGNGGVADLTVPAQVAELGHLIEKAVEVNPSNSSEIWFNIMFPGAYAPFMQILTQTWSSICSKSWVINEVINGAGRPDWNGDIAAGGYQTWANFHAPTVSPWDSPTPMNYGSGPFCLIPGTPDYVNNFWAMTRYIGYFRGWPANFPQLNSIPPAGYVNTVEETWNFAWAAASAMFKNGDADFVAIPGTSFISQLYQSASPPYDPPNYPLNGIRGIHPLPALSVDAVFFTFDINTATPYTTLCAPGTFDPSAIPPDFFGNATWGVHVRKAFAYSFDYATFLATAALGEGAVPATALIPGLVYYNSSIKGYTYNITAATAEFNKVPGLMATGFTLTLWYNTGNLERQEACTLLKSAIEAINPTKFHINVQNIDWSPYLTAAIGANMPCFIIGWLVDFPDAHDFVLPFYHTGGAFAVWQAYSNSSMDALIDKGILTPDGPARQAIYNQVQQLAVDDVPSFTILQPLGRHFERDWINGWYYNVAYPGGYYYNRWKFYYVPEALYNVTSTSSLNQPNSTNLPADVTYDGKVDITDVATVAKAFGSVYGPPLAPRWNFRADINNDRKIDITDVAFTAKQFGKSANAIYKTWQPQGLFVYVTPVVRTLNMTQTQVFTASVSGGTAPYHYAWSLNSSAVGSDSPTYSFTSPSNGIFYIQVNVTDSHSPVNFGQSELVWVTSAPFTVTVAPTTATMSIAAKARVTFASDAEGGTTGYTYLWYVNGVVAKVDASTGNNKATYRFSVRAGFYNATGTYLLHVVVTDSSTPNQVLTSADSVITVVP